MFHRIYQEVRKSEMASDLILDLIVSIFYSQACAKAFGSCPGIHVRTSSMVYTTCRRYNANNKIETDGERERERGGGGERKGVRQRERKKESVGEKKRKREKRERKRLTDLNFAKIGPLGLSWQNRKSRKWPEIRQRIWECNTEPENYRTRNDLWSVDLKR